MAELARIPARADQGDPFGVEEELQRVGQIVGRHRHPPPFRAAVQSGGASRSARQSQAANKVFSTSGTSVMIVSTPSAISRCISATSLTVHTRTGKPRFLACNM